MNDDILAVLHEIAQLLRQRAEQSAAASKRAEERLARMPDPHTYTPPDFAAIEAKHATEAAARRDEAERRRAEDVAFRDRLLKAFEDQNALIRTLLERAT